MKKIANTERIQIKTGRLKEENALHGLHVEGKQVSMHVRNYSSDISDYHIILDILAKHALRNILSVSSNFQKLA